MVAEAPRNFSVGQVATTSAAVLAATAAGQLLAAMARILDRLARPTRLAWLAATASSGKRAWHASEKMRKMSLVDATDERFSKPWL